MKYIDTHQHLWDLRQFSYSWCAGIPSLNRSFLLNDYLVAVRSTGIEKTIFMECNVDEPHALAEARHIQSLADNHLLIAGIVAGVRPENVDFPNQLEALLELSKLRGVRRVLHVVPDEISQAGLFAENIRRLATHKLTFDLCVLARQLPLAIALAKKCPDVQFILDHCGMPDMKGKALDPWRAHIKEIAVLPNVACKISGLVAYLGEHGTIIDDLRPWVERVIACFGWRRIIWGGDWPVCTLGMPLAHWVAVTEDLLNHFSATSAQRAAFLSDNATNIYNL